MLKLATVAAAFAALFCATELAWAQVPKKPGPPPPSAPYMAYAIAAILTGGVCVAAFKNSKRTHQD